MTNCSAMHKNNSKSEMYLSYPAVSGPFAIPAVFGKVQAIVEWHFGPFCHFYLFQKGDF
jgi:hypothetical protein